MSTQQTILTLKKLLNDLQTGGSNIRIDREKIQAELEALDNTPVFLKHSLSMSTRVCPTCGRDPSDLYCSSITANIDTLKVDLKEKKSALKKVEKEVASLEVKKARADAKAAEEAKKAEAESVVKKLLASGMSADEILEKLK